MKINITKLWTRPIFKTVLFYIIAGLAIYFLENIVPSGPCTPGLGILALLLLPFISGILFAVNFVKRYKGQKEFGYSALMHFVVIVAFVIYLKLVWQQNMFGQLSLVYWHLCY